MAIEQLRFDYGSLDEPTRVFVQKKAQAIHARLKRTAEDIIAIGQDLLEVKEWLEHGQFKPWLQSEFQMSYPTAVNFMRVADRFGKNINFIHFPVSVLYELAAPSTPDTVIQMVETGQIPATSSAIREARQAEREHTPASEQVSFFHQWQQDNLALDLDAFGDVPSEPEPDAREVRRQQAREHIAILKERGVDLPQGRFSCLVVDPPWAMQKIERDVRPNQVEFDYPTMSEEELCLFPLPEMAADDCHLYLWTTQKFLPMALRLAEHWGFKYQCLMTWVKNVGFTPYSWMYSTEHVLFCTRGSLPLLTLGKRLDFTAKVREHSRKPDEFYDLVREVSPGPRLDVFSREKRDGFEQYGNEVDKYVSA